MKPSPEDHLQTLLQRLLAAHRAKTGPAAGPDWQPRLMRAVHQTQPTDGRFPGWLSVDRLVWRAAVAAVLAAVMLVSYVLAQPVGTDLIVSLLFDDPTEGIMGPLLNL